LFHPCRWCLHGPVTQKQSQMSPVFKIGAVFWAVCVYVTNASGWADCDAKPPELDGAFEHAFWAAQPNETQFYVQYPTATLPQGPKGWPVMIFMHALNLGWEWYQPQIERWASHGIVVVFPFIKSQTQDDTVYPIVSDTTGKWLQKGLDLVRDMASGASAMPPGLQGTLDLANVAFAGHNMGAVSALRIAASSPKGTVKLVIAMHPFPCDIGPPPPPYTITKAEIQQAGDKAGLILFTSEDDAAFGPASWTAGREKKCFAAATGNAVFASFSAAACDAYPDCSEFPTQGPFGKLDCKGKIHATGKGHFCPCSAPGVPKWVSPQQMWVTVSVRAYLHHDLDTNAACYDLLYGSGPKSLSSDANIADKQLQKKSSNSLVVV